MSAWRRSGSAGSQRSETDAPIPNEGVVGAARSSLAMNLSFNVSGDMENGVAIKRLSVRLMEWLAENGHLEANWRKRHHLHLDFSDKKLFGLMTITPEDFVWQGPGVGKGGHRDEGMLKVPVHKLYSLNLDDNDLEDKEFEEQGTRNNPPGCLTGWTFANLRVLKMRKNKLKYPRLTLPKLRELYMSENEIIRFPPLQGLPDLEVFDLSGNRIECLEERNFSTDGPSKLQTLDLSGNMIDIEPRVLSNIFSDKFNGMQGLVNLQLKDNPFSMYFSEYQLLVTKCLDRKLDRLDDLNFGRNSRDPDLWQEMKRQAQLFFGKDKAFPESLNSKIQARKEAINQTDTRAKAFVAMAEARKEAINQTDTRAKAFMTMSEADSTTDLGEGGGMAAAAGRKDQAPSIQTLITELDSVLEDPSNALPSAMVVMSAANEIAQTSNTKVLFSGVRDKPGSVAIFIEQVTMVAERFEETRPLMIRTLSRFCSVSDYNMSTLCMGALAAMAKAENSTGDVLDILDEVVLPALLDMQLDDKRCICIIHGLSHFQWCTELGKRLEPNFNLLCMWYEESRNTGKDSGTGAEGDSSDTTSISHALCTLLRLAVNYEKNARHLMAEHDMILEMMIRDIISPENFFDSHFMKHTMKCDILMEIAKHETKHTDNMINHDGRRPSESLESWKKLGLHTELLKRVGETLSLGKKETEELGIVVCKKVAAAIEMMVFMMINDYTIAHKLLEPEMKSGVDVSLPATMLRCAREEISDPLVLKGCLKGLTYLIQNPSYRAFYAQKIINELQILDDNRILPYIDRKKFKDLYIKCEIHDNFTETQEAAPTITAVPEFNGATNPIAHEVIVAIVEFLNAFSEIPDKDRDEDIDKVCKELNAQGRDTKLFRLLEVPSDSVKDAVLKCLKTMNSADLDDDEILVLLGLLRSDSVNREEQLLSEVIHRFQEIIRNSDAFRSKYAPDILLKVFEILYMNSSRKTFGNKEEEMQKRKLSVKAVEFMASVAEDDEVLRRFLRKESHVGNFHTVVKNEELEHTYDTEDVCVELTWTGRHLPYLFRCLTGDQMLDVNRKQAFRVFNRIADVLVGVPVPGKHFRHVQFQERAKREAMFWSDAQFDASVARLDESCHTDRMEQQQYFALFNGIEHMVLFLETAKWKEEEARMAQKRESDELAPESEYAIVQKESEMVLQKLMKMSRGEDASNFDATQAVNLDQLGDAGLDDGLSVAGSTATGLGPGRETTERHLNKVFMQEAWRVPTEMAPSAKMYSAPEIPLKLQSHTDAQYFIAGTKGHVSRSYILAAFFRAIYAMLVVPACEEYRHEVISQLREHAMQTRLIGLVERCDSYVDCNNAAKLLRIMVIVLSLDHGQLRVSGSFHLVGALTFANWACRILKLAMPLLTSLGSLTQLTAGQHVLCREALRLLTKVTHLISCMHFPGMDLALRRKVVKQAVEYTWSCENRYTPSSVRAVFLCMIYDMQATLGGASGANISDDYARDVQARAESQLIARDALATFCSLSSKERRYQVFDLFNEYSQVGKHRISTMCQVDIVFRLQSLRLRARLETMLQERGDPTEDILGAELIELPQERDGWRFSMRSAGTGSRMIVVTNRRVLFMARARHPVQHNKCGSCPQESFCPVAPEIEHEKKYQDLIRIVVGPDPQLLILGWARRDKKQVWEEFDFIIFQRHDTRAGIIAAITAMSGRDSASRVLPTSESLMSEALMRRMASNILCTTFALRITGANGGGAGVAGGEERLSLFVLSEAEMCEFKVQFEHWIDISAEETPHKDTDQGYEHPAADADDPLEAAHGGAAHDKRVRENRKKVQKQEVRLQKLASEAMKMMRAGRSRGSGGDDGGGEGGEKIQNRVKAEIETDRPSTVFDRMTKAEIDRVVDERKKVREITKKSAETSGANAAGAHGGGGGVPFAPCMGLGRLPGKSGAAGDKKDSGGGNDSKESQETTSLVQIRNESRKKLLNNLTKEPLHSMRQIEFDGDNTRMRILFEKKKTGAGAAVAADAAAGSPNGGVQEPENTSNMIRNFVDIRFFCDASREAWRRALAMGLARGSAGSWQREWQHDEGSKPKPRLAPSAPRGA